MDAEVTLLPSVHRLRKTEDFRLIRRRGKKYVYQGLIIHISQGYFGEGPSQIGITVGKDCGNSVARHRLSRRIRGAMSSVVDQLPQGSGVVIRALPTATENIDIAAELIDFSIKVKS